MLWTKLKFYEIWGTNCLLTQKTICLFPHALFQFLKVKVKFVEGKIHFWNLPLITPPHPIPTNNTNIYKVVEGFWFSCQLSRRSTANLQTIPNCFKVYLSFSKPSIILQKRCKVIVAGEQVKAILSSTFIVYVDKIPTRRRVI